MRKNGCRKVYLRKKSRYIFEMVCGFPSCRDRRLRHHYTGYGSPLRLCRWRRGPRYICNRHKLVATIWAKRAIGGVAVSPDGKRAYVTANGPSAGTGSVEVIDTVSHTVIADVPMPTLAGGGGIAIAANGKYA
jgi:hypothetical protein